MEFKSNLRNLRIKNKISQENLASIVGVTRGAVAQWENGFNLPSNIALIRIADYFDVSLDYLMGRTEERNSHDSAEDQTSISARYERLTETQKLIVSNLVDEFLKETV